MDDDVAAEATDMEAMSVEMSPHSKAKNDAAIAHYDPVSGDGSGGSSIAPKVAVVEGGVVEEASKSTAMCSCCDSTCGKYCPQRIQDFHTAHPYGTKATIFIFLVGIALLIFFLLRPSNGFTCPTETQFTGVAPYNKGGRVAAPLRGNIGCVDLDVLAKRPTAQVGRGTETAQNVYGPFEAGFTAKNPGMSCLGSSEIEGGVDTNLAEKLAVHICGSAFQTSILDYCGGHAIPYHYHERLWCLTGTDPSTKHSTRIATAADGHGIYGNHTSVDSNGYVYPTDLDACGGRVGVTPDSKGASVYYYMTKNSPPFTLGCYGDKASYPVTLAQCRALYSSCGDDKTTLVTDSGSVTYDLDCPCFNSAGTNVL